jgi:hypothetical protein
LEAQEQLVGFELLDFVQIVASFLTNLEPIGSYLLEEMLEIY